MLEITTILVVGTGLAAILNEIAKKRRPVPVKVPIRKDKNK